MEALQRDPGRADAAGRGGVLFDCSGTDFRNSSCVRQRCSWLTPWHSLCANLGEIKDVIEEEATCASLLGSPPLGNDTHGGSTTKKGVGGGGRQKIQ